MTVIFAALGAIFGACQFFLTAAVLRQVLAKERSTVRLAVLTCVKLAVYAAVILGVLTAFYDYILPVGIGFGIGMLLTAGAILIFESKRK